MVNKLFTKPKNKRRKRIKEESSKWWISHEDGSEDVAEDAEFPCGTLPPEDGDRLFGGREAVQHSQPWIARLVPGLCGAALISSRHLLTAFHCTHKAGNKRKPGGRRRLYFHQGLFTNAVCFR
jgi:hypothetical protein